jgi:hypothetical protein
MVLKLKILSVLKDILLEDVARHFVHFSASFNNDRRLNFTQFDTHRFFFCQLCTALNLVVCIQNELSLFNFVLRLKPGAYTLTRNMLL